MVSSKRRDYLWNTTAGIINAAEAVVMSMIVTRFGLLSDAGILSLAFAIGNVLMTIGVFGVRIFQASDISAQYSFGTYMRLRFATSLLMLLSLVGVIMARGYSGEKAYCIVLIALIYLVEVFENCMWGHFQSVDLLYAGARMFCTRWIVMIIVFTACMVASHDMIRSLCFAAVAGLAVFVFWVIYFRMAGNKLRGLESANGPSSEFDSAGKLTDLCRQVFPLFVGEFCAIFIFNIPKFAIDRYLDDEVQACYGFVAMPMLVISVLNQFIYQPTVVALTEDYRNGELAAFRHRVGRQIGIIIAVTLICASGAFAIGISVLSFLFHTDLAGYRAELVILQFAGGFFALTVYLVFVLTIIRKQKVILAGYIAALITGVAVLFVCVRMFATIGVAGGYLAVMGMLVVYYYLSYVRIMKKV